MTKQAINTRTQEEYDALMEWRKRNGQVSPDRNYFTQYEQCTCVLTDDTFLYGSIDFYECLYYTIIPYTEFAKTIKPDIDYKAKYEEAVVLLEEARGHMTAHVPEKIFDKIDQFLTNHKDGE